MKVSVIIPVYNVERYLDQCLDSVLGQTLRDIEVICVDDGSTDSSLSILKAREEIDSRMRVITQENSYAGVARNNGIDIAQGEYLIFMDSDDFIELDMLESMYSQAKKNDAELCCCMGDLYHNDTGEHSPFQILNKHLVPKREVFMARELGRDAFRFTSSGPPNKLIRRSLVSERSLRFQALHSVNDLYFIDMCVALAKRVTVVTDKVYYHYRVDQTTNLQSVVPKNPLSCVTAATALKEGLIREGLYPMMKAGYDNFVAFELERYSVKLSPHPEAFKQLHDWYHSGGSEIYDFDIKNLDAGTLSNLLMTFEGAKQGMTSEEIREIVVNNKRKYSSLYEGHKKERAIFLLKKLTSIMGTVKGGCHWLVLMMDDVRKKLCNRG